MFPGSARSRTCAAGPCKGNAVAAYPGCSSAVGRFLRCGSRSAANRAPRVRTQSSPRAWLRPRSRRNAQARSGSTPGWSAANISGRSNGFRRPAAGRISGGRPRARPARRHAGSSRTGFPRLVGDTAFVKRRRKTVVGQMGGGFDHSPGVASGTDTTALARPGNEKIVTALGASSAGKAMRENPAFQIPAELTFDMGWAGSALAAVARECEPGGEVGLHGAIEHGTFGPATAIDGSASRGTGGRHGDTISTGFRARTFRPISNNTRTAS